MSSEAKRTSRRHLPLWQETLLLLGIALVLAIVIKAFLVQAFYIPSESMEPQFVQNDRILVQKVSYWTGEAERGDIVVFEDPGGWLGFSDTPRSQGVRRGLELIGLYPSGGHLVKRVIGVGGDTIECCDSQGRISVNGQPLEESSYLPEGSTPSLTTFEVEVPEDHVWVMGDNRGDSSDSRAHMGDPGGGFVGNDLVVGKVFTLVWPFSRAEIIDRPSTFDSVPDAASAGGGAGR